VPAACNKLVGGLIALSMVFTLGSCGGDDDGGSSPPPVVIVPPPPPPPPPPTTAPPSVEREITPSLTGTNIAGSTSPHIAINPSPTVVAKRRLFVMLPGTTAIPRTYQYVVRTGPPRGYHAIGLNYPNNETIVSQCAGSADADCNGKARREVITGEDTSLVVDVNVSNSITGRLVALLTYLNANYPTEGWGQYLSGGQPRWDLITVAGHSQGGGHAAYLAKLVNLDRAVMFSAPGDPPTSFGSPVNWPRLPNITPVDRQYGFSHVGDPNAVFSVVTNNWATIGLGVFGNIVSVDGASAPFSGSHQLSTNAAPNPNPTGPTSSPMHGAPVVDAVTPLDSQGEPLFKPVWIYLAFP
jgi:hypothetical protein